jgi:DNA (cytosine-5)-methyltransferase 1
MDARAGNRHPRKGAGVRVLGEEGVSLVYYNEFDPKAAALLRELIKAGLIPPGDVDERSIVDVNPYELQHYTQHHFFAGIGGWAYALRLAGWPDNRRVVTGSCPCQPFSAAGKQLGEKDERHLWPVLRNILTFLGTPSAFGEQVASAAGRDWLAGVRVDLEALGYEVGAADLCAAGVGAPHIRQRIFWMAHAENVGRKRSNGASRLRNTSQQFKRQGIARGLADSNDHGRAKYVAESRTGGAACSKNSAKRSGARSRLADLRGTRLEERPEQSPRPELETAQRSGDAVGLGNTDCCGLFQHVQRNGHAAFVAGPFGADVDGSGADFWSAFDLVLCTDGKARRIEPGSFPLAHGVPGRVGLLRGYGNAIVPELAAQFIQASVGALRGRG